jgi:hypothetical protein
MKRLLLSLAAVLVLSGNGLCLDLQTAKAQGLVGETPTGYLAPVQATTPRQKTWPNRSMPSAKSSMRPLPGETTRHCRPSNSLPDKRPWKKPRQGNISS